MYSFVVNINVQHSYQFSWISSYDKPTDTRHTVLYSRQIEFNTFKTKRILLVPRDPCKVLLTYQRESNSMIWRQLQSRCTSSKVLPQKFWFILINILSLYMGAMSIPTYWAASGWRQKLKNSSPISRSTIQVLGAVGSSSKQTERSIICTSSLVM